MSDEIKVDLVKATVRRLAKEHENSDIEIKGGPTIINRGDLDPVIQYGDKYYELDKIPHEIGEEILAAAKKHQETIESLKASKYTDPASNPMIKPNPED
jgi:hypothetical protein